MRSHLSALQSSASLYPCRPAFKIPQLDPSGCIEDWSTISYQQFLVDVEDCARYWATMLRRSHIPPRSIVGLWVGGFGYNDVLHIYGLSRAGFIPQMFSLRLPNPDVVYELLQQASAKALIYDPIYSPTLSGCPLPIYPAISMTSCDTHSTSEILPDILAIKGDETAFIFHTSGSTSGSPKLVPCSYQWMETSLLKSFQVCKPRDPSRQDVTTWIGSMCHIAQNFMLLGALQHGSCFVQPTSPAMLPEELTDMVRRCGVNRLNQFASLLGKTIRASMTDPKFLSVLTGMDDVLYTGLALAREEEAWAYKTGMKLRNLYGSTECGAMMVSGSEPNPCLLRPLEGFVYRFATTTPETDAVYQSTGRLLEFIISAESPDCPDISLRHADGDFHTGDLFQEVSPGRYIFRWRDDDWIKSENSLRCDTKSIEDNVRETCGDIVSECIVVGSGRPSPVLFIESAASLTPEKTQEGDYQRTRRFHSSDMVVIVPQGSLPRTATKGNVRRKAVEEIYRAEIDSIFASKR
ncbi:hypothetical protein BD779DRAFT_1472465 [Infundibulicybe gibba]|nr:hypothetical protein BD779DRAFT_1472465 [Infundibulicybe gibba]